MADISNSPDPFDIVIDRNTGREVCIRWCHTHHALILFGKPTAEADDAWHGIRRATQRDLIAFQQAADHEATWVALDAWEHQRCGPIDLREVSIVEFNRLADLACGAILRLSNYWTINRDRLPLDAQLRVKERFDRCRAGLRCFEPIPEAQR